jgi:hypothetical protein
MVELLGGVASPANYWMDVRVYYDILDYIEIFLVCYNIS